MNNKKLTILLKLSGASLKVDDENISFDFLNQLAHQIKVLVEKFNVAIVVGGGNIWRGNISDKYNMVRYNADYIGMLATLMNSIAIESALSNANVKSKIFSALNVDKVVEPHIIKNVKESIENGIVTIFACGTGMPYFSTDTGSAIRAVEIGADFILMGKNNVNGVYSDDPLKNPKAIFYENISYDDLIRNDLKIMDISALSICKEYKIKLIVFKINEPNSIINVMNKKVKFTTIE
ncbi:MAG: UMP kinase [Malacoplasma sp.]